MYLAMLYLAFRNPSPLLYFNDVLIFLNNTFQPILETMSQSPHLPNEIWLQILSHTSEEEAPTAKDLWRSLRPASSQLKVCVEQHFHDAILQHFRLLLPITLPSYDQRNPLRGHAIFFPKDNPSENDIVMFKLERTEPEHFLTQFMTRWESMKDSASGLVRDNVWWEVELGRRRQRLKLRDVRVSGTSEVVRVGTEWKEMMTVFFKV